MARIDDLNAYKAQIEKAMGSPVQETWYDNFRKIMRPWSDLQAALAWVNREIANETGSGRAKRILPRAVDDL